MNRCNDPPTHYSVSNQFNMAIYTGATLRIKVCFVTIKDSMNKVK